MNTSAKTFAVMTALLTSLSACSGGSQAGNNTTQATSDPNRGGQIPAPPPNDPDAQGSALMAAAEPFENLTESAFITDSAKLDPLIAKAKSSADAAAKYLPGDGASTLSAQVAKIDAARASGNGADLAIASVEAYRTLVSNASGNQKIPKQVSLLDYSGFRYQADLKARPVRWPDTLAAVDYADAQWQAISKSVTDASLNKAVTDALAKMRAASAQKDTGKAMSASTDELDLVDKLEAFFARA